MSGTAGKLRRYFHAHESAYAKALNGRPLAAFWQRLLGYSVDLLIAIVLWAPLKFAWRHYLLHEENIELKWDFHEVGNILVALFYLGLANYWEMAGRRASGCLARERCR